MGCAPSHVNNTKLEWENDREWKPTDSGYNSASVEQRSRQNAEQKIQYEEQARDKQGNSIMANEDITFTSNSDIQEKMKRWKPGRLFVDRDFNIDDPSVLAPADQNERNIKWRRPKDLVARPQLLVDGVSRSDISQGSLADCWFLSSCAAIAAYPNLMRKVVIDADSQYLYGPKHTGLVHFGFWRFGKWIDVYIDDRLPVKENNKMMYARSTDDNEFWVSLIEKAYAKLHGSYAALEGGQSMDALVDLTGGLAERYELRNCGNELYMKLATAAVSGAFVTCSLEGDWRTSSNTPDDVTGLVSGHAYTVTDVKRIKRVKGSESLLRVRNPWGKGQEWTGAWCDSDDRWNLIDEHTKDSMQFTRKNDGEFWMSFKDFKMHFEEATICTLGPDFDGDGRADHAGTMLVERGAWRIGRSAGGCRNSLEMFASNPQYLLTVHECDEMSRDAFLPEESSRPRTTCSVVLALMQINRRASGMRQIGFILYATDNPSQRLPLEHFMYNYETAKSGTYVNIREVCGRFELHPGHYVVIPSTFEPNEDGAFLLRVFAQKTISLKAMPDADDDSTSNIVPPIVNEGRFGDRPYGRTYASRGSADP